MTRALIAGALALALAVAATASAQPAPRPHAPPFALTAKSRATALAAIEDALAHDYVVPELRAPLVAKLKDGERAGRYTTDDPFAFARLVVEDMNAVAHDHHLWMQVDPDAYKASLAPHAGGAGSPGGESGMDALQHHRDTLDHHGIAELRILPGNIRYLRITGFEWETDLTGGIYDDALRFLHDGDAIIIDIRGNPGGDHAAVRYLLSHFMEPDKLLLTFLSGGEAPKQSYTLEHVPAGRMIGKPLYVLVDGGVASAAEDFSYAVQQFKLGDLVGATTAGAANNNKLVQIAPGFTLSVSYGKPVHPVSNTNWEGTGVAPSVPTDPLHALPVAEQLALTRLASARGVSAESAQRYAWAKPAVDAELHPVALTDAQLGALAGTYGKATLALARGALVLSIPEHPNVPLVPMTADWFAVPGVDYLRVHVTPTAVELHFADGGSHAFKR